MTYAGNSVYWVGQDGNVYLKNGSTVRNVGKPINLQDSGADTTGLSFIATRINDPNPIPNAPTAAPTGGGSSGGGGGSASSFEDKSVDINNQNAGLAASDTKTNKGIQAIEDQLASILGNYNTESANAEGQYKASTDTNVGSKLKNDESAMVNAAQGRRGLFGTLASLGALGGTGIELANRAVQSGANEDLSNSEDAYKGNQTSLDTAVGNFRTADKERRDQTGKAAENAKTSARNEGAKEKQGYLVNLANDYAAEGDSATAKKYSDMAAALYGDIANTAVPSAGPSYISAAFQAPTLTNSQGNGATTVSATPAQPGGLPGLFANNPFVGNDKKKVTA
jgi:hypothetical protein